MSFNLCYSNKYLSSKILDFIDNVGDIKEESITDYLVWKWHKYDKKFKFINIETYTKYEENKITGADFSLELWLLGNNCNIPLLIQAKKFIDDYGAYCSKLNYPKGTQKQLQKLITHANNPKNTKLPFYLFYSKLEINKTYCNNTNSDMASMFLLDAEKVKYFADNFRGKSLSKQEILENSLPFHCLFCCINEKSICEKFKTFYPQFKEVIKQNENKLPEYIELLLIENNGEYNERLSELIQKEEMKTRNIAVYDLRNLESIGKI